MKSVADFAPSSPMNYPGERHTGNFLMLGGEEILDVPDNPEMAIGQIDQLLLQRDEPKIEARVPVLAFGRNASPGGVVQKAVKYTHGEFSLQELGTVPMLQGSLAGHDVVWHGRPGQVGGYFAELERLEEADATEVEVWVQFLTNEQLAVIHATEGVTYELSGIADVHLGGGLYVDTVGYTAREACVLLDDNKDTIPVAGIKRTNNNKEAMDATSVLQYTLGQKGVEQALLQDFTPESYINTGKELSLLARKERQQVVDIALRDAGRSRGYRYDTNQLRYGRADFSSLPRGVGEVGVRAHQDTVNLMEHDIARIRPSRETLLQKLNVVMEEFPHLSQDQAMRKVRKRYDPAEAVRKRASDELLDPNREERLKSMSLISDNQL